MPDGGALIRFEDEEELSPVAALRNRVRGLAPAAWFQYGQGITVTGAGVSQWDDQSGNSRHLKQATDTNRPAKQADGSILFDGVDNYLKCDAFTLNHPETIYLLMKQVTYGGNQHFFDGNTVFTGYCRQVSLGPSPNIEFGTDSIVGPITQLAVGAYGVVSIVLNDTASSGQVNNETAVTGDCGSVLNMGGFILASRPTLVNFANIQVKEVILFAAAHTAAQRASVIAYLRSVGGI